MIEPEKILGYGEEILEMYEKVSEHSLSSEGVQILPKLWQTVVILPRNLLESD